MVKEKATRIFVMISAVAWYAMSAALTIAQEGEPVNREDYARMIIAKIESRAGPNTQFGKAMETARREYGECHQAYNKGSLRRRKAPRIKIPVGILLIKPVCAQKRSRCLKIGDDPVDMADSGGSWKINIAQDANFGGTQEFYTITWTDEDDKKTHKIEHVSLSKDVVPSGDENRYIYLFVRHPFSIVHFVDFFA